MHYLMYAFTNKGKTSEEARQYVKDVLENDDSFLGEGGLFGHSVADWFVIGGRWSGTLNTLTNPKLKGHYDEVEKAVKAGSNFGLSTDEIDDNRELIQKLWEKKGGKFKSPYLRDSYEELGEEDDAVKVTPELYKELMKDEENKIEYDYHKAKSDEWHTVAIDMEYDDLEQEGLNKGNQVGKWVVVVDYHN